MLRPNLEWEIQQGFEAASVVALLGPRQCGKTTLARDYFEKHATDLDKAAFFDLENPVDLRRLEEPMMALAAPDQLFVIDEIQRVPDLFTVLRVLVDEPQTRRRFLILGSASRELIRQSSESLAGRIHYIELTPFSTFETGEWERLLWRGGFPRSYLPKTEEVSWRWRHNYIRTYLEQDLPNLGIQIPPEQLRRFWLMLAHMHGQAFNASELGSSLGISHHTAKRYLDILNATFMVRVLTPWHENLKKRQVKTPKIYFRDSGLFHALLAIKNKTDLLNHPKLGASWEGFALEEVIRKLRVDARDCYFWATQSRAELDLVVVEGDQKIGFEFKYQQAPRLTPSMQIAMEDLKLKHLTVIYPGQQSYFLKTNVQCVGLKEFCNNGKEAERA